MFRGGQVAVDATGQITCVGCDCAQGGETVITCPNASDLAGPHQHARPHHVHAELAVHRHGRALRASPAVAQGHSTATRRFRRQAARRREDQLGRAPLPDGRRDVDRRLGRRSRACFATSTTRPAGGPQPQGRRLRHVPARRLERHAPHRCCNYGTTATPRVDRQRTTPSSRTSRRASTRPRTTSSCARARRRTTRRRRARRTTSAPRRRRSSTRSVSPPHDYGAMAATGTGAHLVAALEHHALRRHRARHDGSRARRRDRARHRLDADRLDEHAARAALRRQLQHRPTSTALHRPAAVGDGHVERGRGHRDRRRDRHARARATSPTSRSSTAHGKDSYPRRDRRRARRTSRSSCAAASRSTATPTSSARLAAGCDTRRRVRQRQAASA